MTFIVLGWMAWFIQLPNPYLAGELLAAITSVHSVSARLEVTFCLIYMQAEWTIGEVKPAVASTQTVWAVDTSQLLILPLMPHHLMTPDQQQLLIF